jgi:hypothetical protein
MVNLSTRHLLKSDGPQLLRGFHLGKSRSLVARTPDLVIPDFPKWEISQRVASVNWTAQVYPGVSTLESPEISWQMESRFRNSRFPKMGDLTMHGLR